MEINRETVLTVPNAISLGGFALVLDGARKLDTVTGLAEVVGGRLADLGDGWAARHLNQGSKFGAAVDANLDKFGGLAILVAEWHKGIAPKWALGGMFTQNLANGVFTAMAMKANPNEELTPSRSGKYAMAAQNLALFTYAGGNLLRDTHPGAAKTLRNIGHAATIVGVGVFGAKATFDYFKRAHQLKQNELL